VFMRADTMLVVALLVLCVLTLVWARRQSQ
jgi:hypothetical protein